MAGGTLQDKSSTISAMNLPNTTFGSSDILKCVALTIKTELFCRFDAHLMQIMKRPHYWEIAPKIPS